MSYGYSYGNDYRRGPRINEDDVPESKHTIFVRGLPGSMSTDEIKDYFEDKIGPVSFDFVKTSPDNQRLFVAVRFETREDAKSAMTEYSKRDLLGYRCDLTWFKDVRRFAEYQRAQGITPGRGRGSFRGRGGFSRGGYRDRRHSRDRSRSRGGTGSSRSRSRSRSRGTRSGSGTPRSLRRSRSNSRSKSRSISRDRRRSSSRGSNDSRDNDYRRKDRKRSKSIAKDEVKERSRRSRSNVSSDREVEHEKKADRSPSPVPPVVNPPPPQIKVTIKTTKEDMIPMPPAPPQFTSNGGVPVESPAKAYLPAAAPPPAEFPIPTPVPAPHIGPSVDQLNTSFTIRMDTAETKIIQKTENTETVLIGSQQITGPREEKEKRIVTVNLPPTPTSGSPYIKPHELQANTPRGSFRPISEAPQEEQTPVKIPRQEETPHMTPSQYQINANPYNSWTPVTKTSLYESPISQKDNGFGYNGGVPKPSYDLSKYPLHSKLFSDLRDFQEQQIASVKAIPQEETLGSLALSTLSTNNDDVEADKRCIREQVLASMKEIELERFTIHKRKLENAFKGDCTTYAIVTKRLLSKDPSLEKQLRMCLIESMEDLEKQMFDKIDAHLGI